MRRLLPSLLLSSLFFISACDTVQDDARTKVDSGIVAHATEEGPRRFRPVVLSEIDGDELGLLIGSAPDEVVAFAYDNSWGRGRYVQIPVQVDERHVYDLADAYEGVTECQYNPADGTYSNVCENLPGHVVTLGYSDSGTAIGADPDPTLDEDDEVVLLLSDFGNRGAGHPRKVVRDTRVEVAVDFGSETVYAYIYRRDHPSLDPSARTDYVTNGFALVNGTLGSYDIQGVYANDQPVPPPGFAASNPEHTVVTGQSYAVDFADRWIMNGLRVHGPDGFSADLLEVDMIKFSDDPSTSELEGCGRTPYTASLGEGAFLVNTDGPIRAIRRVIGFNSGPLTDITWTFYPYGFETEVNYRVHPMMNAPMSFFDLSDSVTIHSYNEGDGPTSSSFWQTLAIPGVGGWATLLDLPTNIAYSPAPRPFYQDTPGTPSTACPFDNDYLRAAHGIEIPFQDTPNTDPRRGPSQDLVFHRTFGFGFDAEAALAALQTPTSVQTTPMASL